MPLNLDELGRELFQIITSHLEKAHEQYPEELTANTALVLLLQVVGACVAGHREMDQSFTDEVVRSFCADLLEDAGVELKFNECDCPECQRKRQQEAN